MSPAWRQATWQALQQAAAEGAQPEYAAYATLREAGQRAEALMAIRALADRLVTASLAERWVFVSWLFAEIDAPGVVLDPLVPQPLRDEVVLPTLWEELARTGGDPRAAIWLVNRYLVEVLAANDYAQDAAGELLRDRLARSPDDPLLRARLAEYLIHWVEQDAAALGASRFDGDPVRDLAMLDEALRLLDPTDPEWQRGQRLRADVEAWQCYREAGDDPRARGVSFAAWREAGGGRCA